MWFENKMISIPHIKLIEEHTRTVSELPELPEFSVEDTEKAKKALEVMRSELKQKLRLN